MPTTKKLTQKENELVAVAASIASGCQPCTAYHVKTVREAGASEAEVVGAIGIALDARNSVTEMMAEVAQGNLNNRYPVRAQSSSIEQPIKELMSMAAALICNSVDGLEYYLAAAKLAGASTHQIQTAIVVAQAIREEAAEKADAVIEGLIEPSEQHPGSCCQKVNNILIKQPDENVTLNAEKQKDSLPSPCDCS